LHTPTDLSTSIQHSSGNKKAEEEAYREAEASLQEITKKGGKMSDEVVEKLLQAVIDVRPEPSEKIIEKA
jgi:V-type H+-transporting ATPase subunit G